MRYVIVGTGNISSTYVNALSALPESTLVGAVSRAGRALKVAPEIPVWPTLGAVDSAFDAVILATPNGLHHQGAIEAASLGKHVLTEKPLDISIEAMDRMTEACRTAGVMLAVCFQRRTRPDNQAVKALVAKGAFGRIYAVDLAAKFYRDQSYYDSGDYRGGLALDGGGPFMQQACHNLDIYTWLFGLPRQIVSMLETFAHAIEAEDHGAALMRHEDGMIGTVVASTAAKPGFAARMEVHTERGSFTLTDDVITQWDVDGVENPSVPGEHYHHDGATSAAVTDTSAHEAIIEDFEAAVRENREPLAGPDSARKTTELILDIYKHRLR
ncbi:Gfo/Idh/MocA family protein [Marinimicrobium alkaliphilum]|uniref:Gfo/Idh/MocA family protein n=1 Tax=Marinimicrobium alkaliphilum TaxID=2202654 RepID=UPI0018E08724|nr:Gfo/Idh/MocA family oxidoreductase [Marinimicrobium alkaliphilum]